MGRPLYIERLGMLDLTKMFQITSEEKLTSYYIYILETLVNKIFRACSVHKGKTIDKCVVILDLKGASTTMLSKRLYNFLKCIVTLAQDYYPETLSK